MRSSIRVSVSVITAFLFCMGINAFQSALGQCAMQSPNKGKVLISEFRTHGPTNVNDEFVELYNNTNSDITVGTGGWSLFQLSSAAGGTMLRRALIPSGTVLPARGHYLIINTTATGYSLSSYATGDQAFTSGQNLAASSGLALFDAPIGSGSQTGNSATQLFCSNRIDAVGFNDSTTNGGASAYLFFDSGGATDALTPFSTPSEHSFVRVYDKTTTFPTDTDKNNADFVLVSTTAVGPSVLGTPGPENTGSAALAVPSPENRTGEFPVALFDPGRTASQTPNRCYDSSATSGGGAAGSLFIRRNLTNNSVTSNQLRFRVIDITTVNSPGSTNTSQSIIKPVTSVGGTTACPNQLNNGTPVTVQDTTLDAPSLAAGGGVNSSLSTTSIPPAENRNVLFRLGADRVGSFRFYFIIEGR